MKSWNPLPLLFAVLVASLMIANAPSIADATPPAIPTPVVITDVQADAYIRPNQSTNGTGTALVAGNAGNFDGFKILIRFNPFNFPPANNIHHARMVLTTATGGSSGYDYSEVKTCSSTTWNNNVSYTTANGFIGGSAGSNPGIEGTNKAVYDLTSFTGSYAIVSTASIEDDELTVYSSDHGTASLRPKMEIWKKAKPGDANLDEHFNSADMVQVFAAGKYETGQAATWAQGDWNEDGVFNSSDLSYAYANNTYEG